MVVSTTPTRISVKTPRITAGDNSRRSERNPVMFPLFTLIHDRAPRITAGVDLLVSRWEPRDVLGHYEGVEEMVRVHHSDPDQCQDAPHQAGDELPESRQGSRDVLDS